jgi:hypothetical protein
MASVMTTLADTCAFLGDATRAAELERFLRQDAGRSVVAVDAWVCFGAADRALGWLAATMHRSDEAEAHFRAALGLNQRLGAMPWLAHTRHAYAQMLLDRHRPGDADRARPSSGARSRRRETCI